MKRRLIASAATLAASCVVLSASSASAQTSWRAIDLDAQPSETPEMVCLLHEGAPGGPGQLRIDAAARGQLFAPDADRTAVKLRAAPAASGLDPDTLAAWNAMLASADRAICGASLDACIPRVELESSTTLHLVCARNTSSRPGNGKVLVARLHDEAETPRAVRQVALQGSVVRFELGHGAAEGASLHVRVAGGHYRPGPASSPVGARFPVHAEPLCRVMTAELPAPALAPAGGRLRVEMAAEGREQLLCEEPVAGAFALEVPPTTPSERRRLRVRTQNGERTGAVLEAGWVSTWPPERLSLRPTRISFTWEAPCEYPANACPAATLPEAGMECTAEALPPSDRKALADHGRRLSCAYSCTAAPGTERPVRWPAKIEMRDPDAVVDWSARLVEAGQTLRAYLPAEERSFPVRFDWPDTSDELLERPGDRIRYVEVKTPAGRTHRIAPRQGARVTIPDGRCGDTFASQVVGDRAFAEDTARIEDGWLVIPDPARTADGLRVGGMIGGGFMLPSSRMGLGGPDGLEARAYGTAQLAFRIQPEPHVASALEPRAYELHLSYVIAQQPYFPVHAPDARIEDDAEYLPFNRWALEVVPLWQLGQRTQLGVGMGMGLGFPVRTRDEAAVGKSRLFWIPVTALARVQVSHAFSVEGSFRMMGPEKVYRYEPSPWFAGTPERTQDTTWSGMLGLVGLRLWL